VKRTLSGLSKFRIGDAPKAGEGLRIGVTRRPPRGVSKDKWASDGYFDVWYPHLAPSEALIAKFRPRIDDAKARKQFFAAYEKELLGSAEARQAVELLAAMSLRTPVSLGCFCEDEERCHRSRLFEVVSREAGRLAGTNKEGKR
jgi:uncharacterized protein YeaO (DUF488 family)